MKKNCKICQKEFYGRADKIFCSVACKNNYNKRLRRVTEDASKEIDDILHRNRSILLEVMGKYKTQLTVERIVLDKKNFNFSYLTGYSINNKGKTYQHVYDFSYMVFSSQRILIVRKK